MNSHNLRAMQDDCLMTSFLENREMLDIYSGYGVKYAISPAPFS